MNQPQEKAILTAQTKEGIPVLVQIDTHTDGPDWRDPQAFLAHFQGQGYVIARSLLPSDLMDNVVASFRAEVKPYTGTILRQLSVRMEQNKFSANGFMTNTILSVQDLTDQCFESFRHNSLNVLTHERVKTALEALVGEQVQCVESMYFESSARGTISHSDCHFMDSSAPGEMVAAWYALEDIHPCAGRFYIMPESHLFSTEAPKFAYLKDLYNEYEEIAYKTSSSFYNNSPTTNASLRIQYHKVLEKCLASLSFIAPVMKKGDVVFWRSQVLHGSLSPEDLSHSRNSLTAHYIGQSKQYIQYGNPVHINAQTVNGMSVHCLRPIGSNQV